MRLMPNWSPTGARLWQAYRHTLWAAPEPRGVKGAPQGVSLPPDWAIPALWRQQRAGERPGGAPRTSAHPARGGAQ